MPIDLIGTTQFSAPIRHDAPGTLPDHALLASHCPRGADSAIAECVGRLLTWDETRIDDAVTAGLQAGAFRPRD